MGKLQSRAGARLTRADFTTPARHMKTTHSPYTKFTSPISPLANQRRVAPSADAVQPCG